MSLHGGKVAQIRTKVRHGHRAQVCHWLDEGSPWRMAELEVEEEEEEERGQQKRREPKSGSIQCVGPLQNRRGVGVTCALFFNCAHYGAGSPTLCQLTVYPINHQ